MHPDSPDYSFLRADNLTSDPNNINEAMEVLSEILALYPDYGRAYNHLGWIYERKLRDYERAEECYKRCIALSPDYSPAYYNYAYLLLNIERYDELEKLSKKALKTIGVPKDGVYEILGMMYETQGDYDTAITHYKKSIQYCLYEPTMDTYNKAIDRCHTKKEILSEE